MSRTNLILLALVAAAGGLYLLLDRTDPLAGTGPAPRLFPEFNKESAERIVMSGGWKGQEYVFERLGSAWSLKLPGVREGYPVKAEEAGNFIDAVANLRRENPAGDSDELIQQTLAGEPYGRLVQVFAGSKQLAAFRVGKNPKQAWEHFFIRRDDEKSIYRTRTLLTKDRDKAPEASSSPFGGGGARGWDWKNYTGDVSRWFDTQIWSLGSAEVIEIKLHRSDLDVALVRLADEKWEARPMAEGAEPFPADTSAVDDIKSRVNYLSFEEVVGGTGDEAVLKEYGLDQPEITLVLKLKKKIEKKPEEPKEPEEQKPEEKKPEEPEYKEFDATITVGKKIKVKERFEEEEKKVTEEEYYAIRVAGNHWENPEQAKRENFIFLVSDYKVASLRKSLD